MVTRLGTNLGTTLGTTLGTGDADELADLENYLSLNLFSWMRADYRAEVSGKVTAFFDKVAAGVGARAIDTNHAFSQGNSAKQVAAITTSPISSGKECALFVAANSTNYDSTIATSNWRLHNGTGWETFSIYAPSTISTQVAISTDSGGTATGYQAYLLSSGEVGMSVTKSGGVNVVVASSAPGQAVVDTLKLANSYYKEGLANEYEGYVGTSLVFSGMSLADPTNNDPSGPIRLGSTLVGGAAGSAFLNGRLCDAMIANRVDATLRSAVRRYRELRYPA